MQKIAAAVAVALLATGCAMQMVEQEANDSCAKLGKKAFLANAKQSGIPLVIESASVMVVCVGPEDITHLPAKFGADAISSSNLGGVGVLAVVTGSAADKAGLKPNDIISEFAGAQVTNAPALGAAIERTAPGDRALIKLRRKGQDATVTAQF